MIPPECFEPGRWWRVLAPDGSVWCETSDAAEAVASCRPGDQLQRQYRYEEQEWRPVKDWKGNHTER